MVAVFNENSRVKIPALLHLTRLGYKFLSRSEMTHIDPETNIFITQFKEGISKSLFFTQLHKHVRIMKHLNKFICDAFIIIPNLVSLKTDCYIQKISSPVSVPILWCKRRRAAQIILI